MLEFRGQGFGVLEFRVQGLGFEGVWLRYWVFLSLGVRDLGFRV